MKFILRLALVKKLVIIAIKIFKHRNLVIFSNWLIIFLHHCYDAPYIVILITKIQFTLRGSRYEEYG